MMEWNIFYFLAGNDIIFLYQYRMRSNTEQTGGRDMKRYRKAGKKEADWQTRAVKSAVQLFKGLFDGEEASQEEDGNSQLSDCQSGDRICLPGICLPVGNPQMGEEQLLWKNLRRVQRMNDLEKGSVSKRSFSMSIPEGNGRNFVILRTIMELNRVYGILKFIVVVPSVAARHQMAEAVQELSSCFLNLGYPNLSNCCFSCRGENLREVSSRLVESDTLSVCIMNIQTFNRGTNRLRAEDEYGQVLWDDIRAIRPVIILEEPQTMESERGERQDRTKSYQALEDLNPLFIFRMETEWTQGMNQFFCLTEADARAEASMKKLFFRKVEESSSFGAEKIRQAVEIHFKKQMELLREGSKVKVLTLFFTASEGQEREAYLKQFDQEYREVFKQYESELSSFEYQFGDFNSLKDPKAVRHVFLGIDKRGEERELSGWEKKDSSSFRKRLLEDVNRGIEVLLAAGRNLKSFDCAEAFLFVHPALWEGCENPNLFVICCLDAEMAVDSLRKKAACGQWPALDQEGNLAVSSKARELVILGESMDKAYQALDHESEKGTEELKGELKVSLQRLRTLEPEQKLCQMNDEELKQISDSVKKILEILETK